MSATVADDARTVHLFKPGSIITTCCQRASLDARIVKDLGTYDAEAASCPGLKSDDSHSCESCKDCLHEGEKCCGCYDGACCRERHDSGSAS